MTNEEWPYGYGFCCCGCGQQTGIAQKTNARNGYKKGDRLRFVQHHWGTRKRQDVAERFWSKVDKTPGPDACWAWNGTHNTDGYGRFSIESDKSTNAHRFAYELTYGPIPKDKLACHVCDNPGCCNPSHIFIGTPTDNMRDKVRKGRQSKIVPRPRYGEHHHNHVLSEEQIKAIRDLYERCEWKQLALARIFSVKVQTIHEIVHYRSRLHG